MNWKRIICAGGGVICAIAIAIVCTKSCSDRKYANAVDDARTEIKKAREVITELDAKNNALRDSVQVWRDSTDFYKNGLKDCQNSKKTAPAPVRPATSRPTTPAKPVVPAKPKAQPADTLFIVCEDVVNPQNRGNTTTINMEDNSKNNKNIIVQNGTQNISDTEITLGTGAVNDGNIIVNNGGKVVVNDNSKTIDSLRVAVDSLKSNSAKGNYAAASSIVVVKKVKTYTRVR